MLRIDTSEKDYPSFSALIERLVDMGYKRVYMVLEQGEFSVRGAIIDVFSVKHATPIRIEYFGDEIDRLGTFDVTHQRFLLTIDKTRIQRVTKGHKSLFMSSDYEGVDTKLISNIREGDYVVHEDYGVGQFKSLEHMAFSQYEGDYALIEYKGSDKLYVPIEQFHLLHRYSGGDVTPKVNRLHDGSWGKAKEKAQKAVRELAEEVYEMLKTRQSETGFAFAEDTELQLKFEEGFPYQETKDQLTVIQEIKAEMESENPMDRLVCGDVGFGKTELLMRAAFKAVENLKQVAVLVPTTILAEQHLKTFKARFDAFGYAIEGLSRLRSKSEIKETLKKLKEEKVNVVIGTHRLLQKDVIFNDLGLLIVDEEQRFGVTHKERIKQMKANVDVLSTSATPIPRTLYMSLTGAKQFSLLNTPPKNRKPIHTTIADFDTTLIKTTIEDEIKRGGQVYYLHNRVDHLKDKVALIKKLCPRLTIGMMHGRLSATAMEAVMTDFYQQKFDVLVCTTIIENGLDIPSVNTIIMDGAETLGLSQIHQIKGRVGRSGIQGYAYLLVSDPSRLSEKKI